MAYFHGARSVSEGSSVSTPVVAESGITAVIGTCPSHRVKGGFGKNMIYARTFEEAKATLGYSDDWTKYTACEAMYAFFKVFGVSPLIIINAEAAKTDVAEKTETISGDSLTLPEEVIRDTLVLKDTTGETYTEGKDYELEYSEEALTVTFYSRVTSVKVSYASANYDKVGKESIIGGTEADGSCYGAECIDYVFPTFGVIPDIAIAPSFSENAEVAAILAAKMEKVNTIFHGGTAFIDIDCERAKTYTAAPAQKKAQGVSAGNEYALWPMVKLDDRVFHLSTVAAALCCSHDAEMGNPCESPSNLGLKMTAACLKDGSEVMLNIMQANYLNANGIATALPFMGALKLWGNEMANYPSETDVPKYFLNMYRMRGWIENTLIQTHWTKVDRNQTRRLIDNVADSANIWLNGLVASGAMLSASVEVTAEDNPTTDVIAGITKYRVKLGLCSPSKEMVFITEYDAEAAVNALAL